MSLKSREPGRSRRWNVHVNVCATPKMAELCPCYNLTIAAPTRSIHNMRLYYLTARESAEKILKEQRFKLSTFDESNDPFELQAASVKDRKSRQIYRDTIYTHWSKTLSMLCTSTTWHSPVMWAHYGDKHRGVCIGFDTADGVEAHEVKYEPERLNGLLDPIGNGKVLTREQVLAVLTTKFADWSYERERRIFAGGHEHEPDRKCYLAFRPNLILREVILGARCEASLRDFAGLVNNPIQPVEVFKARAAFDSFSIVRQQQVKPIIVHPDEQSQQA